MSKFHRIAAFFMLLGAMLFPAIGGAQAIALSADEARAIAKEAYIYGYPMVDHYRIQHSYFVDRGGPEYKGPWNQVHNTARVYTPDDRAIQSPNSDTPYSFIGADLRAEPLVITVPAVEAGRYYSLQFVDAYTHNFAFLGSRTTGNGSGRFLLAGPQWSGEKPGGVTSVIRSETEFAFVMFRTQLLGPQDIGNVKKVQAGYRVQTLSSYMGRTAAQAPAVDFPRPLSVAEQRNSLEFFNLLNFVLQFCPLHPSEQALMQRLARLDVGAGRHIDIRALSPELKAAIEAGMTDAWQALAVLDRQLASGEITSRDLFGSREHLHNNYLYRMRAAVGGIYGMDQEEALYPIYYVDATGRKLDGADRRYTMRFAPGQLPPANAFWSLTMYELPSRTLVSNPLGRYLINSPMLPELKRDADGGITLYVQHDSPGKDKESNWLPAPEGTFFAALRVYWPKPEALNGEWKRPALQPAESGSITTP
ncbi:DUF1254 domain-containing protein [Variovorax sp. YR216]|uniref:DUF1254 domain-containing protein n=1 Tax=Variovorax sp. YR216 TaxID=1882828 RepID=UPI000899F1CE|nr:DUF1254 domain-containing protein [Variovorax sp. YR216]SEB24621.1 Uncharacterized conserved protein [Variovorax sp. YR216]